MLGAGVSRPFSNFSLERLGLFYSPHSTLERLDQPADAPKNEIYYLSQQHESTISTSPTGLGSLYT